MRRLQQPGPAPEQRIESIAGHGRLVEFDLQPGLPLNDALTRPLVAAGMRSAALVFHDVELAPLHYCVPGPPQDASHVAWFSAPRSATIARIEIANATFGRRDGAPFVHCHGVWMEPQGRCGGHILPHETVVAVGGTVRAWALTDVTIVAQPDPETNSPCSIPCPRQTRRRAPGWLSRAFARTRISARPSPRSVANTGSPVPSCAAAWAA